MEDRQLSNAQSADSPALVESLSHLMPGNPSHEKLMDVSCPGRESLLAILRNPDEMWGLSLKGWEVLIPQARFAGIWPQLAAQVRRRGKQTDVPAPVWRQMEAALRVAEVHANNYRWEVNQLQQVFVDVPCPLILLKGVAFQYSDMPWSEGRSFQDIDILVPHGKLTEVESALRRHGWVNSVESPLDAMYYRRWLQELPPMWHPERKVVVDIHHSIIRPRDYLRFDASPLFEDAVAVRAAACTLSPVDMVLHAASNLFCTGEFNYLLRDLHDAYSMLEVFSKSPEFWSKLISRAEQLNLVTPLYYALRYMREIFNAQIPADVSAAVERGRPGRLSLNFLDFLVRRTLFPNSLDQTDAGRNLALKLREYWAVPRLGVLTTGLFWLKRLPKWLLVWLGLDTHESAEKPAQFILRQGPEDKMPV